MMPLVSRLVLLEADEIERTARYASWWVRCETEECEVSIHWGEHERLPWYIRRKIYLPFYPHSIELNIILLVSTPLWQDKHDFRRRHLHEVPISCGYFGVTNAKVAGRQAG